jgi:hypothetical protein
MIRSEDIYEAALDPEALDQLPNLLAQACGGRSAVLSWLQADGTSDVLAYSHLSAEMMADYVDCFAPHDVWSIKAMTPRFANRMLSDEDIVSSSHFKSTIFYNDFIRRHGEDIFHVLGGSQTSVFGNGLLGIYRHRGDDPFSTDDKTRLTSCAIFAPRSCCVADYALLNVRRACNAPPGMRRPWLPSSSGRTAVLCSRMTPLRPS